MRKHIMIFLITLCLLVSCMAGCGLSYNSNDTSGNVSGTPNEGNTKSDKVKLKFFTGKIETIDIINEIINDFNASQNRITVEQEYQKDASNIIKIKFASADIPDIMTTYEQGFVDDGKFLDLSNCSQWWDRLLPSMKESCTDVKTGKQYRVCTNMTMAGFFYNKDIFSGLNLETANTWMSLRVIWKPSRNKCRM